MEAFSVKTKSNYIGVEFYDDQVDSYNLVEFNFLEGEHFWGVTIHGADEPCIMETVNISEDCIKSKEVGIGHYCYIIEVIKEENGYKINIDEM